MTAQKKFSDVSAPHPVHSTTVPVSAGPGDEHDVEFVFDTANPVFKAAPYAGDEEAALYLADPTEMPTPSPGKGCKNDPSMPLTMSL